MEETTFTPGSLTKEMMEGFIETMSKMPRPSYEIEVPAFYLLMCSDEEFIALHKSKTPHHFGMCGMDTHNKISERRKQLL